MVTARRLVPELRMRSYYAARATEYDRIYLKPERQTDLRAIEKCLPRLFSDARLLEIACGTGYWTRFMAPFAAHIVALDLAVETLRIARSRVPAAKVDFVVGDAYDLPLRAGAFDAAFAGFWFSHVPKCRRREFLIGLGARLRPGARVVLLDNRYVEGSSTPISDRDGQGNSYQTRRLADQSTHRILKNFPSEAELQDLLDGIGQDAIFTSWQYFWSFEYVKLTPQDQV